MQIPPKREDETEAQWEDRASKAYDMWKDWQEKAEKFDEIAEAEGTEVANQKVYGIDPEPTEEVKKLMEALRKAEDDFENMKLTEDNQ